VSRLPAPAGVGPGPLIGAELELEVGPVAHGGHCVARHEGRVVFVRHALPGEQVRARVTEDSGGSYCRADAVAVLRPAPERVEPPCPYARPGRCGGCDWQHADPAYQRELKAAVVREQLARLGGRPDVAVEVEEVPGGALGWRTRVRFAVRPDGVVGLHRHRSGEVEPIERCLIAAPQVSAAGVQRRRWPAAEAVTVTAGAGRSPVVVATPRRRGRARSTASATASRGPAVVEVAAGRRWRVSGGGFWQVHPAAADTLVEAVLGMLAPRPGEQAVDLYAGVGLFAGALAPQLASVTAVEGDRRAARDAAHNLADLSGVRVLAGDVQAVLAAPDVAALPGRTDLVVLDPPRSGAGRQVVELIAARAPRAVAYVACDPAALARDVATFASLGYRLRALRAFDLFPMTAHVECVALLEPEEPAGPQR